jgi:hypothetical protein
MSFIRRIGPSEHVNRATAAQIVGKHADERRTARSGWVGTGTLACDRCDAPVALTAGPVSPIDILTCPFCSHRAPARDFLSLAPPTRPARVTVRATYNAR